MTILKTGRHQQATDQRTKATRKTLLGIPVVWWLLATATGVAIAAWLIANSITGTVSTASVNVDYEYTTIGEALSITSGDCTATYAGLDEVALVWSDTLGGDQCQIKAEFTAYGTNSRDLRLQSFDNLPTGITGSLGAWCGTTITAGYTGPTINADILLTIDPLLSDPASSYDLGASGASFVWVPASQYDPLLCS